MNKTKRPLNNEQGFASIVIALILIVVLALLTVGFASLARREQQDALDKQLATQANYAAESGVNDIYNTIINNKLSSSNPQWGTFESYVTGSTGGTQCLPSTVLQNNLGVNPSINSADAVAYTCALVNLTPTGDQGSPQNPNTTWGSVFSTPNAMNSITVTWSSYDSHNTFRGAGDTSLPPNTTGASGWGKAPPVLEVSFTPLGTGTGLSSSSLINNTFTAYLYPSTGSLNNPVAYQPNSTNSNTDGPIVQGDCSTTTNTCSATINNIGGAANDYYLMHIVNLPYDTASWAWSPYATNGGSGSGPPSDVLGSQVVIDVTGHDKNVLKRLREVLSINGIGGNPGNPPNTTTPPDEPMEAQNICKRFNAAPPVASVNPAGTTSAGPDASCAVWQYP